MNKEKTLKNQGSKLREVIYVEGGTRYYNMVGALAVFGLGLGGSIKGAAKAIKQLTKITTEAVITVLKKYCTGVGAVISATWNLSMILVAAQYYTQNKTYTIDTLHIYGVPMPFCVVGR